MNHDDLASGGRFAREGSYDAPHDAPRDASRDGLPGRLPYGSATRPHAAPQAASSGALHGVLVEEHMLFSPVELSRACGIDSAQLCALVEEGVLAPIGDDPQQWRFEGSALRRARTAARLAHDLDLSTAATALVLELLDRIDALTAQLERGRLR